MEEDATGADAKEDIGGGGGAGGGIIIGDGNPPPFDCPDPDDRKPRAKERGDATQPCRCHRYALLVGVGDDNDDDDNENEEEEEEEEEEEVEEEVEEEEEVVAIVAADVIAAVATTRPFSRIPPPLCRSSTPPDMPPTIPSAREVRPQTSTKTSNSIVRNPL